MKILHRGGARPWRACVAVAVAALGIAWGPSIASASQAQKAPKLSMSNITVANGPNASSGPLFVALYSNIYKKYGLNVNWVNTTAGAIASVTVLLSGSAQFTSDGAAAQVQSVQNGAPIRALMALGFGGAQEIDLANSFVAAHHIPTKGNTVAQVTAQFKALKGTHANLAISSPTSNAYAWFVAAAVRNGISYGIGCSTCDVNITSVGSVPNQVAALNAGKVNGLINVPPYTRQANSLPIHFYKLPPLGSRVIVNYIATTIQMIQQHPDTVQAFVNAIYDAVLYTKTHPKQSAHDVMYMYGQTGTTDVPTQQLLWNLNRPFWQGLNPYPTKASFNNTIGVFNYSLKSPFSVPYQQYVYTKFAKAASKTFHLSSAG